MTLAECIHTRYHVSGPKRYDFDPKAQTWYCRRDQSELHTLLADELSGMLQQHIVLNKANEGLYVGMSYLDMACVERRCISKQTHAVCIWSAWTLWGLP